MEESERQTKADHLCVLVHGYFTFPSQKISACLTAYSFWGNSSHLQSLSTELEKKYDKDHLHVFLPKSNSDNFTYDGIDVGGERVAQEIENELERLEKNGNKITKLSVVGYSLGGLIARYCIGLLYSRGWFDRLQPVNFTAFASPFLGVRTPVRGYHSHAWNALGSKTLSSSGAQLFIVDSFRDTGRPLLGVLADPDSIFIRALARFKNRVLYANVQNDRSAPWYTTAITAVDPYEDLDAVEMNFVKGYARVVGDPNDPVSAKMKAPTLYSRILSRSKSFITKLPIYALVAVLGPIATTAILINSGIQSIRSNKRIQLHNEGKLSEAFHSYRIPLMVEGALESINANERQEYLEEGRESSSDDVDEKAEMRSSALYRTKSEHDFPTLALAPEQFKMIEALDKVGFRKYPVLISQVGHSHAAIIVRMQKKSFEEGWVVIRHWLNEEFEI